MIRLPLPSYLLCPVQRICKYSLLLESLLKVSENEDDEMIVLKAIQSMKKIPQGNVPENFTALRDFDVIITYCDVISV